MPDSYSHQQRAQPATERLLEQSWEARERRASQRELLVEGGSALLFAGVAAAFLLGSGELGSIHLGVAGLLIAVYAAVARVELAVGAGSVVPTLPSCWYCHWSRSCGCSRATALGASSRPIAV